MLALCRLHTALLLLRLLLPLVRAEQRLTDHGAVLALVPAGPCRWHAAGGRVHMLIASLAAA